MPFVFVLRHSNVKTNTTNKGCSLFLNVSFCFNHRDTCNRAPLFLLRLTFLVLDVGAPSDVDLFQVPGISLELHGWHQKLDNTEGPKSEARALP